MSLEGKTRFISQGNCGTGHCSLQMKDGNGRTMIFGGTEDSRNLVVVGGTPVLGYVLGGRKETKTWALSKARDQHGNVMTFHYIRQHNNIMLTSIKYNNRSVEITYKAGPATSAYIDNAKITMDRLVASVSMYTEGQLFKKYSFTYDTGLYTGRARLRSITECDAGNICLEPTKFKWSDSNFKAAFTKLDVEVDDHLNHATYKGGANLLIGDYDGDGHPGYHPPDQKAMKTIKTSITSTPI